MSRAIKKSRDGDFKSKKRSGRPSKFNSHDISTIKREVTKNPFVSSKTLENKMAEYYSKQIDPSTIRKLSLKENLKSYVSKVKPLITKKWPKKD